MGNSEKGRWVTIKGKHLFISDDPYEKQEKEIQDSKKRADEYNKSRQEKSDPVKENAYYRGLAEDANKILSAKDSDFDSLIDKSTALYQTISKFNKYGISSGETYEKLLKENHRIEEIIRDGYVNPGRYESELKKRSQREKVKQDAEDALKARVEKLKKENPKDYVTKYGIVLKGHNHSLEEMKKAVGNNTEVHFVDGRAESAKSPAGTIAVHKGWNEIKDYNFDDTLEWGWFTDTDNKKKIWFYLSD